MKTKQLTEGNAASETNDKDHFELHILQKENVSQLQIRVHLPLPDIFFVLLSVFKSSLPGAMLKSKVLHFKDDKFRSSSMLSELPRNAICE